MRYLKLGSEGPDVLAWETFLRGLRPCSEIVVDGKFGSDTVEETKIFQRAVGFLDNDVDGVVGNMTLAKAAELGFNLADDDGVDELGPNWPVKPDNVKQLNSADRARVFGAFAYVPAPVAGNPEAIRITDDWSRKNITTINIPQLKGVQHAPATCNVQFHVAAANQLKSVFEAWEQAGLKDRILTWGGTWVPRFIRGSRTVLSNHAWGTAFDINVQWNMLGTVPTLKDKKGSVRELVSIAYQHGFFWGGHFPNRPDGMHFEIFELRK